MPQRNIFTQYQKGSIFNKKLAALFFAFIALAIVANTIGNLPSMGKKEDSSPTPNTSLVTQETNLTTNNYFEGLSTYQEDGNNFLKLNFTNLGASSVNVTDNETEITIQVGQVKNSGEYADINFLFSNLKLNRQGESLTFTFDKNGLDGRYLIQQHAQSIELKLLSNGLEGKKIVIDPGHGGIDPGAVGPSGITEKEVVLPVALKLQQMLVNEGAEVILTRETDTRPFPGEYRQDLIKRVEMATEFGADMFISLHNNASAVRSVRGMETLYNRTSVNQLEAKILAELVQEYLVGEFSARDRGNPERTNIQLNGSNFVSVLPEMLFITNPEDEAIIKRADFAQRAAQSLFKAIKDYYSN